MKQNRSHRKKMAAPIIITSILVLYYIGFFICCSLFTLPFYMGVLLGIIPLALTGVSIYVLVERIKEIRSGEEDDLGQY